MRAADSFRELTYANPNQPRLKRWFIRSVEELSGRRRYARLYEIWRREVVPSGERVFGRMLELIDVGLAVRGAWPQQLPDGPLVIVANHPFGIGDGIAVLALAERLGRPFRVMINAELLKIGEMRPYSLPIDFEETKEALKNNMAVRHEALRLLKSGVTIVVFPAGGVATAPKVLGKAEDLPWKLFPARLIREARASVLPVLFSGQNGPLFHLASRLSLTARLSLLIHEFTRLSGRSIEATAGRLIRPEEIAANGDRKALTQWLRAQVFSLDPQMPAKSWRFRLRLPLRGRARRAAA